MPLRPINAIFIEQKQQFIVVYQQGKLWQLPRMKLDMSAWRYRKPFLGNKSALVLARDQHISDAALANKLPTHELPDSLHGVGLARFETWWRQNGFDWLNNLSDKIHSNSNQNPSPTQTTKVDIQTPSQMQNMTKTQTTKQASGQTDNIFDDMLADLQDNLLK